MKKGSLFAAALAMFLLGSLLSADEVTRNLESRVLDAFDSWEENNTLESHWAVNGSRFITENSLRMAWIQAWPEALYGANWDQVDYRCLGVQAAFDRQGYNYVEIIPVNADGEAAPIAMPGRPQLLSMWVWGSNFDYYLEVHLRDYMGIIHVLPMGSLDFSGWQNLSVQIPSNIPVQSPYLPRLRTLDIVKFVVWTRPSERVNGFYIYFDQLKVLTDVFESRFDGDDLANPDRLDAVWSNDASGAQR